MEKYAYGRIRKLDESLHQAGIDAEVIAQIMEGGEAITERTSPAAKADWLREAIRKMDRLIEAGPRHSIRESCACCLGGKRLEISKAIARDNQTLEGRIRAANEARFVFGHSVTLEDDGKVMVRFAPEGWESYGCPCLPKAKEPLPLTYCYCCGGHAKHHLQTALGRKLEVTVIHTALSTGGKKPCTFQFRFAD
ncbi:MAG TPA: hypothetical protein VGM51_12435 [Armatimonadota bacterium]|jgi:hypothetical protein